MSYSFTVVGATKAEAKEKATAKFDEMVGQQPIHARDRSAALATADSAVDLLGDNSAMDVSVHLNGYVSWTGLDVDQALTTVSISCMVSQLKRAVAAPAADAAA